MYPIEAAAHSRAVQEERLRWAEEHRRFPRRRHRWSERAWGGGPLGRRAAGSSRAADTGAKPAGPGPLDPPVIARS